MRRSLCGDVNDGQALDLVAKEVKSNGFVVLGGPYVDDATAHGNLGSVFNQLLSAVPHRHKVCYKFIAVDGAATL
jgi:hypothetical protein